MASLVVPPSAATRRAFSNHAWPKPLSVSIAASTDSSAALNSPRRSCLAAFSIRPGAVLEWVALPASESRALWAIRDSSPSSVDRVDAAPRASSLFPFLMSLWSSELSRRIICSFRAPMSSGTIARRRSSVLSREPRSPLPLWISERDLSADSSSGSRSFALWKQSAAQSNRLTEWKSSPTRRCSAAESSTSSAFISASVSMAASLLERGFSPWTMLRSSSGPSSG